MNDILVQWAVQNKIPKNVMDDLLVRLGVVFHSVHTKKDGSEAALQTQVRLAESKRGSRLFRNNSGVAFDKTGRPVRFGLANDSAKKNRKVKSSDLIGLDPDGRFVSLECKRPGWVFRGTDEEMAQLNWIVFVNAMGGRANFVSSLKDYESKKDS